MWQDMTNSLPAIVVKLGCGDINMYVAHTYSLAGTCILWMLQFLLSALLILCTSLSFSLSLLWASKRLRMKIVTVVEQKTAILGEPVLVFSDGHAACVAYFTRLHAYKCQCCPILTYVSVSVWHTFYSVSMHSLYYSLSQLTSMHTNADSWTTVIFFNSATNLHTCITSACAVCGGYA